MLAILPLLVGSAVSITTYSIEITIKSETEANESSTDQTLYIANGYCTARSDRQARAREECSISLIHINACLAGDQRIQIEPLHVSGWRVLAEDVIEIDYYRRGVGTMRVSFEKPEWSPAPPSELRHFASKIKEFRMANAKAGTDRSERWSALSGDLPFARIPARCPFLVPVIDRNSP